MKGEIAPDRVPSRADAAVEGHIGGDCDVNEAEKEGKNVAVGRQDGVDDTSQCSHAREQEHEMSGSRLLELIYIGQNHCQQHSYENEGIEPEVEFILVDFHCGLLLSSSCMRKARSRLPRKEARSSTSAAAILGTLP